MTERRYDRTNRGMLEYFCNGCGHLRLSFGDYPFRCLNCGSIDIDVADAGSLDKEKLKDAFNDQS